MSLAHETIRVPVTALASVGPFLLAAEGPFLRIYYSHHSGAFTLLGTRRIFNDHAIHGISLERDQTFPDVLLAVWGGPLIRFLKIDLSTKIELVVESLQLSVVTRAPDWILDLSFGPVNPAEVPRANVAICAAVTAHNALIELTIHLSSSQDADTDSILHSSQHMSVHLSELTSSSRSILYSANLLWDTFEHILIAAGTAFGEIIYWSWARRSKAGPYSCIHRVFLGHEGSIFGVSISREFDLVSDRRQRLLASCSDDRTIRVWDVSGMSASGDVAAGSKTESDVERTRHTGFTNASFDTNDSTSTCLALGWGHVSRVWAVRFLDVEEHSLGVSLLSAGEDATSRVWRLPISESLLSLRDAAPIRLEHNHTFGYHSGKNMWSTAIFGASPGPQKVVCGGADSKITAYTLPHWSESSSMKNGVTVDEYTIKDLISPRRPGTETSVTQQDIPAHKSSNVAEFFRSYAYIDSASFLLTTNSGKVFIESLDTEPEGSQGKIISNSELLDQLEELSGYSICAAESSLGVGFVAGSRGSIFAFRRGFRKLLKIHSVQGKVGNLLTGRESLSQSTGSIVLLATLMGRKEAQLLHIDLSNAQMPAVSRTTNIPISGLQPGLAVTSLAYVLGSKNADYVFLGFRNGSVAIYSLAKEDISSKSVEQPNASLFSVVENVHGKETVTSMVWQASRQETGYLLSVGRDGCCAINQIDFSASMISLVHRLPLPVGPNLEGLYYHYSRLMVYGFSSTKFVVYDTTAEEVVMSIETGGSHRSWAFQPHTSREGGGTLVWTRSSSMHVCSQTGPNHEVIRFGGHGREMKAVAVSNHIAGDTARQLIATGAEDTDIKIFEYEDGDFVCRRTLRKHTTGIQHLKWSSDGGYLFSSGGCEEFYIWRIQRLPGPFDLGVVCESVYTPESEHSDLRIMSFDVCRPEQGSGFIIALVFSDSSIKVYSYDPAAEVPWHTLAKGIYSTSCLTQCVFLSLNNILTAGTDGYAVIWTLPLESPQSDAETSSCAATLSWKHPARIHQCTSKTLDSYALDKQSTLLVSGGDDGSLAFLSASSSGLSSPNTSISHAHPPVIVVRAHASAVTACAILSHNDKTYVLTSGNDQWVRLWEVIINTSNAIPEAKDKVEDSITIKRLRKIKTNVADVSSIATLEAGVTAAKVLICGVGMEVLRIDWGVQ